MSAWRRFDYYLGLAMFWFGIAVAVSSLMALINGAGWE
jgi:hypothetical protein